MAGEDRFAFQASFEKSVAAAQELIDQLTKDAEIAKTVGDETWAAHIEAQKAALAGPTITGRTGSEITADTAAIGRENAVKEAGLAIDKANLDIIEQQTAARLEQAAVLEKLQRETPELIIPTPGPAYGPREQTAGGQLEAEAAAQREAALKALTSGGVDAGLLASLTARTAVPEIAGGGAFEQLAGQQALAEEAQKRAAVEREILATQEAEQAAIERQVAEADAYYEEQRRITAAINEQLAASYQLGRAAGAAGTLVSGRARTALTQAPTSLKPGEWTEANAAAAAYNTTLGEYTELSARADLSTEALTANLTRLGIADAEASDQLRRHGALTTEFLGALARGETTVSEFGYQIGATIGKFAGWATAAAATYGALGAVVEFGKGAIDTASATQQLTRTIDGIDPSQASAKLQQLSQDTNVSMKEAGDATFAFSRTFHNLDEAVGAARLGLAAYKLDQVSLTDSVRASTAIVQQYGGGLGTLTTVYNELSASQREYNARISDMIPLLQKSTGAVRNAGGDLTQLIQLGTFATRVTQLSGSQIGTALYRAASNFTNPATTKGQTDISNLNALGVNTGQGFTELLASAIRRAATLSDNGRSQLALSIFGPQFGGRLSAIFNPQEQRLFSQITGAGPQGINPQATQGSLQIELSKELKTAGQQLDSFINGLQRLGASFAETGIVSEFAFLVHIATEAADELRGVVNIFNELPGPIKEAVTAILAVRAAMLFFSRTRFGSSAPLITSIPGFRPSAATLARSEQAIGGRQAIQTVQADLQRTSAEIIALGAEQATLQQSAAAKQAEINKAGAATADQMAEFNQIQVQLVGLQSEQADLEAKRTREANVIRALEQQQVGLTAINRNVREPDSAVLARQGALAAETSPVPSTAPEADVATAQATAQTETAGQDATAQGRLAAAKTRLAAALGRDTAASRAAAAALEESAAASGEAAGAATTETAGAAADVAGDAGLATRVGGLVAALDPLTVGLLALPFAFQALSGGAKQTDNALSTAVKASQIPINSLSDLDQKAKALQQVQAQVAAAERKVEARAQALQHSGGFGNDLSKIGDLLSAPSDLLSKALDKIGPGGTTTTVKVPTAVNTTAVVTQYAHFYDGLEKQAKADEAAVESQQISRAQWQRDLDELRAKATAYAQARGAVSPVSFGGLVTQITQSGKAASLGVSALKSINDALTQAATQVKGKLGAQPGANPFSAFQQETASAVEKNVEYWDDYAKVFGAQSSRGVLQRAAYAYAYLASKFSSTNTTTDAQLQQLATAEQNFVETVTKNVEDLLKNAQYGQTFSTQSGDLGQAYGAIEEARAVEQRALDAIIKEDKGNAAAIAKAKQAADQIFAQLNDQLSSVITAQLSLIETRSEETASQITGSSPGADIARAQQGVVGLEQQLAKARQDHADYQTIAKLITQINTARNDLVTQVDQNARSIAQAQGNLRAASIQGSSPEADIARARAAIASASALLAFDQAHGAGLAQILQDQADLDTDQQDLLKQISANARSIEQAQGALAAASITGVSPQDDIARARVAVSTSANLLAFDRAHGAGEAQILQDQADLDNNIHALNEQLQQRDQQIAQDAQGLIQAQDALAESNTLSPIRQARDALNAANKSLATIKPDQFQDQKQYEAALKNAQAARNNEREKLNEAIINQDLSTLQYEYNIEKIGDQQYINGLQRLLQTKKLTLAERQSIEQQIYQLKQGLSQNLDLNVGNIKLPSVYEVRRALGLGKRGGDPASPNVNVQHNSNVTVNVGNNPKAASAVGRAIDQSLNTTVDAAMRAAGVA